MPPIVACALLLFASTAASKAQCPQGWEPGDGRDGVNGGVYGLAKLPDGDVIAGGAFTKAGPLSVDRVARYSPATQTWSPLRGATGFTGLEIRTIGLTGGDDLIIAGRFSRAGGLAASNIVRHNLATGAWSTLGAGISGGDSTVYTVLVLPNGRVLAGGSFTSAGGAAANNIAQFDPATGVWSTLGAGVSGTVRAMAALPSGEVIVAGTFATAGGTTVNSIARLNPATGGWSSFGGTANSRFFSLSLNSVGELVVGGEFTSIGGIASNNVARYSPGTSTWSAFGAGTNGLVSSVVAMSNGDLVVGGWFTSAGGRPANRVARFNSATGVWSGRGGATYLELIAMLELPDGTVLAGGSVVSAAAPTQVGGMGRFDPNLLEWTGVGRGTSGIVRSLMPMPSGEVVVGGNFTAAGGVPTNSIAVYNPTTGGWSAWRGGGMNNSGDVYTTALLPDGDLVAGGTFVQAGGTAAYKIARFRQSTGVWMAMGNSESSVINLIASMLVLSNGDLLVGGSFQSIGGVTAYNIARYQPASGTWLPVGSGVNSTVLAMAELPGGDVIITGSFTVAGDISANRIARVDPVTGVWSPLGAGLTGGITSGEGLLLLPDGNVVVGGSFTAAGGVSTSSVAQYNPTTGAWSAMGGTRPLNGGVVQRLALLPNGEPVACGTGNIDPDGGGAGWPMRYIRSEDRWVTVADPVVHYFGGRYLSLLAVTTLPAGDILVGGAFDETGNFPNTGFARVSPRRTTPQIRSQPESQVIECPDSVAAMRISMAGSGTFTYRWRRNGVPLDTTIERSAATATLALNGLTSANSGVYDCIVTTSCGTVTSAAAELTVIPCPCSPADVAGAGPGGTRSDGSVDGNDFIAFMNSFALGDPLVDPAADIAGSTAGGTVPDGAIDGTDFIAFINAFAVGC